MIGFGQLKEFFRNKDAENVLRYFKEDAKKLAKSRII